MNLGNNRLDCYNFEAFKNSSLASPPRIFNDYGEEMVFFYLKDSGNPPYSLSVGKYPRHIFWDRFNRNLDTHFYVHEHVFGNIYTSNRKYGVLRESEEIIPGLIKKALKRPELICDYNAIFTHSERLLDRYENAKFAPACCAWYGNEVTGGVLSEKNYELKTKNVSIIASDKSMCEIHKIRAELARYYIGDDRVDCYGRAVDRYIEKKSEALEEYRYSIVLENSETSYYFTEKILDCFAAMTIPIYMGATQIDKFFNSDGIIRISKQQLSDFGNVDKIIDSCCEQDYLSRLDAVKDNYRRVQNYLCYEDYLYDHYEELRI